MDARINLWKRDANQHGVFNWDDVVVDPYSGLSYHEKKQLGFKVSPRDMMLSQYLRDHVHYRTRRICRYNRLEASRAVEFGDGSLVSRFFANNELLFSTFPEKQGLCNIFKSVLLGMERARNLRSITGKRLKIATGTVRRYWNWLPPSPPALVESPT